MEKVTWDLSSATRGFLALFLGAFGLLVGCGSVSTNNVKWDGGQSNTNDNTNYNQNMNQPDASLANLVTFKGVTWAPGSDDPNTLEVNRFPIPGVLVAAYNTPPPELPQEMYCNECVEVPNTVPNVLSDPVNGTFELTLCAGNTYYLVVQKGEFRRVREIQIPNTPGEEFTLEPDAPGVPKPAETTLPNRNDPAAGDNIPKIAIIDGAYEDQSIMFEALGFDYEGQFDIYEYDTVDDLLGSYDNLAQYNLIIIPCGESWPGGSNSVDNLREYVRNGGKLYIDDFNYDFAEQVWPEFLVFYVRDGLMGGGGVCGDGDSTTPNECNDWEGSWDFTGTPGDEDFENWIKLPEVNGNNPIELLAAWDSIYEINSGEVGIDPEHGTGPNGEVYLPPKVWMYGDSTPAGDNKPTTVSWPFYCGKVAYTVYHTHDTGGGSGSDYELLLQEKIMMYLIMEVQTCSTGPVVE